MRCLMPGWRAMVRWVIHWLQPTGTRSSYLGWCSWEGTGVTLDAFSIVPAICLWSLWFCIFYLAHEIRVFATLLKMSCIHIIFTLFMGTIIWQILNDIYNNKICCEYLSSESITARSAFRVSTLSISTFSLKQKTFFIVLLYVNGIGQIAD
jgi:uncharacterized membrane protein (UPF0182 family)